MATSRTAEKSPASFEIHNQRPRATSRRPSHSARPLRQRNSCNAEMTTSRMDAMLPTAGHSRVVDEKRTSRMDAAKNPAAPTTPRTTPQVTTRTSLRVRAAIAGWAVMGRLPSLTPVVASTTASLTQSPPRAATNVRTPLTRAQRCASSETRARGASERAQGCASNETRLGRREPRRVRTQGPEWPNLSHATARPVQSWCQTR